MRANKWMGKVNMRAEWAEEDGNSGGVFKPTVNPLAVCVQTCPGVICIGEMV